MPSLRPQQRPVPVDRRGDARQPLLLLDGPAYQAKMAKTMEQERELLKKLNLLAT